MDAALSKAGETFAAAPTSPPSKDSPTPASLEGRHRLGGAFAIARERIRPDPNQPRRRTDTEAQKELNDSVKRLGILQPITVRFIEADGIYQIIAGERRYHAACEAKLTEIPCWVQEPKEQDVLLHQIVENWQRLDMHPYDLADGLARLRDANRLTQRDLARETGKSEGEISKLLSLLDLDPAVQKVAREDVSGRFTRRHLYAIRTLPAAEQIRLVERTRKETVTAEQMEALVDERTRALRRTQASRGTGESPPVLDEPGARLRHLPQKDVTAKDIVAALDEARVQASPPPANRKSSKV